MGGASTVTNLCTPLYCVIVGYPQPIERSPKCLLLADDPDKEKDMFLKESSSQIFIAFLVAMYILLLVPFTILICKTGIDHFCDKFLGTVRFLLLCFTILIYQLFG